MKNKTKELFLISSGIVLSLFIFLIFLEFFCRFYIDDGMNYEFEMMKYNLNLKIYDTENNIIKHKKNKEAKIMDVNIETDSNGFRVFDRNQIKEKKILMIGDSMTFGFGSKKTFSEIIDNNTENYSVFNAGVGNTNTIMQVRNFLNFQSKVKPNVVILNFFINDLEKIEIKNFFLKNLYSINFLYHKFMQVYLRLKKIDYVEFYKQSFEDKDFIEETFNSIRKLNEFCKENNIKLFVHILPELNNVQQYPFLNEEKIITDHLDLNKISYVQGISYIDNEKSSKLWVSLTDRHANEYAHSRIAEYLINFLKRKIDDFD